MNIPSSFVKNIAFISVAETATELFTHTDEARCVVLRFSCIPLQVWLVIVIEYFIYKNTLKKKTDEDERTKGNRKRSLKFS